MVKKSSKLGEGKVLPPTPLGGQTERLPSVKFITLTTDSGQVYVNPFHIVLMIATQGGKNANTFLGFSGGELSVNEETDVILGMIEKTYGPEA